MNAITKKASSFDIASNLQQVKKLFGLGQLDAAEELCQKIVNIKPSAPHALHLLGMIATERGRLVNALELIKKAIDVLPANPEFWMSKGHIETNQYDPVSAKSSFNTAIDILQQSPSQQPNNHQYTLGNAIGSLGVIHTMMGDSVKALKLFDQSLGINPDQLIVKWNRTHALLLQGNYKQGLKDFELRFQLKRKDRLFSRVGRSVRWQGENLNGKRILVHDEQGYGDLFQFCRFIPELKQRGATHVTWEIKKTVAPLFFSYDGVDDIVIRKGREIPDGDYDYHVAIMSLPYCLGMTLGTIPAELPYIYEQSTSQRKFTNLIKSSKLLNVGLVWAGQENNNMLLRHRTCDLLPLMDRIGRIKGVKYFGLQLGERANQIHNLDTEVQFLNLGDEIQDFSDTAAAINCLDLVISIDTSVAHLTGALGKPCWIMLNHPPHWRWLEERFDCPWYPTARLFRSNYGEGWDPIFHSIGGALEKKASLFGK